MPHHEKKSNNRAILVILGAVLFLAVAAVATVHYAVRKNGDGPEAAAARLSSAVKAHDADGAMAMIDFDAVFKDAWLSSNANITGSTPSEEQAAAGLANPLVVSAKKAFRKNLVAYITDPTRATGDSGAFFAALNALDAGQVVREGENAATVKLPNNYSLRLALVPEKRWMVVAFHGYEKDYDAYKHQATDLMKEKGLTPSAKGDPAPPPEEPKP